MSRITKRKYVQQEVMEMVVPTGDQQIVKITASRGHNLHGAVDAAGEMFLVSMPKKFRQNIFVKRGSFIIMDPIPEGGKVRGEITHILFPDHIRHIQEEGLWPQSFGCQVAKATSHIEDDILAPSDMDEEDDLAAKYEYDGDDEEEDDDDDSEEDEEDDLDDSDEEGEEENDDLKEEDDDLEEEEEEDLDEEEYCVLEEEEDDDSEEEEDDDSEEAVDDYLEEEDYDSEEEEEDYDSEEEEEVYDSEDEEEDDSDVDMALEMWNINWDILRVKLELLRLLRMRRLRAMEQTARVNRRRG